MELLYIMFLVYLLPKKLKLNLSRYFYEIRVSRISKEYPFRKLYERRLILLFQIISVLIILFIFYSDRFAWTLFIIWLFLLSSTFGGYYIKNKKGYFIFQEFTRLFIVSIWVVLFINSDDNRDSLMKNILPNYDVTYTEEAYVRDIPMVGAEEHIRLEPHIKTGDKTLDTILETYYPYILHTLLAMTWLSNVYFDNRLREKRSIRNLAKSSSVEYETIIKKCNEAIQRDPVNGDAYYSRGFAKISLKEYRGAIEDLTYAIEYNFKDADAHYSRGLTKVLLKEYSDAIEDFTNSIKIDPNYASSYSLRGYSKAFLKDYPRAIEDFTKAAEFGKAIKIDPYNVIVYYGKDFLNLELEKYKADLVDLTKTIEDDHVWMGVIKFILKDYESAYIYLTKAIENYPLISSNTYYWRGRANLFLEDYNSAIADFTKAMENAPYSNLSVDKWLHNRDSSYWRGVSKLALGQEVDGCKDLIFSERLELVKAKELRKKYC